MGIGQAVTGLNTQEAILAYFIASYDLHNKRTYPPVWEKLENLGASRLLESLWVLTSTLNASQIRDELKTVIDSDDSVTVIELKHGSWWASLRAQDAGVEWLRQNIKA